MKESEVKAALDSRYHGRNPRWRTVHEVTFGTRRQDFVAFLPQINRFELDIVEIKVSKADYRKELETLKWQEALPFCHRFWFASPAGIIDKAEVPEGVGLMHVLANGQARKITMARRRDIDVPHAAYRRILMRVFDELSDMGNTIANVRYQELCAYDENYIGKRLARVEKQNKELEAQVLALKEANGAAVETSAGEWLRLAEVGNALGEWRELTKEEVLHRIDRLRRQVELVEQLRRLLIADTVLVKGDEPCAP